MARERLSGLQRRILQVLADIEARRGRSVSSSHVEVRQAVGGNKGNVSVSMRSLEAKGLVTVYRTRGGKAESVWLTPEGTKRACQLNKVLIKD